MFQLHTRLYLGENVFQTLVSQTAKLFNESVDNNRVIGKVLSTLVCLEVMACVQHSTLSETTKVAFALNRNHVPP